MTKYNLKYNSCLYIINRIINVDFIEVIILIPLYIGLKVKLNHPDILCGSPKEFYLKHRYVYVQDIWDNGYIDHVGTDEMPEWLENMMNDDDALLTYLFGDAFVITGNDNGDDFRDTMYEVVGENHTPYGTWTEYGGYKEEYENYDIYYKGN